MEQGKFIVFEGIDGSGVSTHAARLKEWLLKEQNHFVHLSAEPTDSPIGALIKTILKSYWDVPKRPDLLGLLYAADRLYHVEYEPYGHSKSKGLRNALQSGYVVVYSRYILSSLAYQGLVSDGISVSEEWLKTINNFGNGLPTPDLTIFLDVPPRESILRIQNERDRYEVFENKNDLQRVYNLYKKLIQDPRHNVVVVNGLENGVSRPIQEVQDEIRTIVKNLLENAEPQKQRNMKKGLAKVNNPMRRKT